MVLTARAWLSSAPFILRLSALGRRLRGSPFRLHDAQLKRQAQCTLFKRLFNAVAWPDHVLCRAESSDSFIEPKWALALHLGQGRYTGKSGRKGT